MIVVTGTKRSGTSLWMQILIAAGLPAFGEAFPLDWEQSDLRNANPDGFFESVLREGIYYRTNPHPQTAAYFHPEQVEHHCVKVFIPGVIRSERAYLGRVLATVREWREYEASVNRLWALEDADAERRRSSPTRVVFPPWLEWWNENYNLIRDVVIRRYAIHVVTFDRLLVEPDKTIRDVLGWIGRGDAAPAIAAVNPQHRTQKQAPTPEGPSHEQITVFDQLYDALHRGAGLTKGMIEMLNATHAGLREQIQHHEARIMKARMERDAASLERGEIPRSLPGDRD